MRFGLLFFFVLLACHVSLEAQNVTCKYMSVQDTHLPIYPPIARLAHMQGTIRFSIHVPVQGVAEIKYLDGPNQGVFQTLVANAGEYAAGRKYDWPFGDHHDACDYVLAVEYRIVAPEVNPPNNFLRVTVIDESHTLIEARSFKPTCFDCRN